MKQKSIRKLKTGSREKFQRFSFTRMLPNIATVMALCLGLTSIRFAFQDRFEMAVGSILIAAVLDAMDGRLARLLRVSSDFGAELDSLSDFISFGVAPAILLHLVIMHQAGSAGWGIVLLFSVCSALRLARFNITRYAQKEQNLPEWTPRFFTGVPAPAGAMIALFPIIFYFATNFKFIVTPVSCGLFLLAAALLMISRLPTFSLKSYQIPPPLVIPVLLGLGLGIVTLVNDPWLTLSFLILGYIFSLPVAFFSYRRKIQTEKNS